MRLSMRRRFSGMNQVAGGFLGDLGVDRFLERPGPTSVAREDHICDGRILRWPLRGGQFNACSDRMNIVCLVRTTGLLCRSSLSKSAKSLVPYRQCSAHRDLRMPRSSVWSIVDTAICSGPLAFAVDAVSLWGLNRLSPVTD